MTENEEATYFAFAEKCNEILCDYEMSNEQRLAIVSSLDDLAFKYCRAAHEHGWSLDGDTYSAPGFVKWWG